MCLLRVVVERILHGFLDGEGFNLIFLYLRNELNDVVDAEERLS